MFGLLKRVFNYNERELRRLEGPVRAINALEPQMERLSDEELARQTARFQERLERGESLDDLLVEAFATVREAARRVLGMRPFDVQLMGGIVLHQGKIAEMATGEGKTLVATLPSYLNALAGKGVHVVTVNDYLARRDAQWMGQVHRFLGLEVGVILHDMDAAQRQRAYAADITYGTNNEFGFDYLRDNMVLYPQERVQRGLHYAIVDEVDSILIDEARTPLIISGVGEDSAELYYKFAEIVKKLKRDEDYTFDEKNKTIAPTEQGVAKVERMLGVENLYDTSNMDLSHYLINALKAKELMLRDRDYVVKDGEVIIVDEFTGRLMFGRRYSDGLHQAIEAKEGVTIQRESQTLATITFQNYFRMYKKLAGMTGTAATEADEFAKIYKLDVVVIPTNLPLIRQEYPDQVYKTEAAKWRAVVREIKEMHGQGRPVLVGTTSVEKSERLSQMLKREGIPHQVLNAKYHEKEAQIVAQAGRLGAVTVSTNMAGRGTDILLGGNPDYMAREELTRLGYPPEVIAEAAEHGPVTSPEVAEARQLYRKIYEEKKRETDAEHEKVVALGGLHVIGTERHEARRIDNQLRGRAGRQGDPGSSRFFVSLEDDLMRLFGGETVAGLMDRLGVDEDEPIEHGLVTRAIENAQRKVEAKNFEARKQLLEYDDVLNQQREVIYEQRRQVLEAEELRPVVERMVEEVVGEALERHAPEREDPEEWDLEGLVRELEEHFLPPGTLAAEELRGLGPAALREEILEACRRVYDRREELYGRELMGELERFVMLRVVDSKWIDHLDAMDDLREGIGLRAYGQSDPLVEYRMEGHRMFEEMVRAIRDDIVRYVYRVQIQPAQAQPVQRRAVAVATGTYGASEVPGGVAAAGAAEGTAGSRATAPAVLSRAERRRAARMGGEEGVAPEAAPRLEPVRVQKVGRNDPCPCGSGKKYKHCHGRAAG
ncbi:MAG: preprotein translocase subunit SecA [Clostridia bacterium]|nr:preprotein translocase subunit SecA [Clostridia bacterium]